MFYTRDHNDNVIKFKIHFNYRRIYIYKIERFCFFENVIYTIQCKTRLLYCTRILLIKLFFFIFTIWKMFIRYSACVISFIYVIYVYCICHILMFVLLPMMLQAKEDNISEWGQEIVLSWKVVKWWYPVRLGTELALYSG